MNPNANVRRDIYSVKKKAFFSKENRSIKNWKNEKNQKYKRKGEFFFKWLQSSERTQKLFFFLILMVVRNSEAIVVKKSDFAHPRSKRENEKENDKNEWKNFNKVKTTKNFQKNEKNDKREKEKTKNMEKWKMKKKFSKMRENQCEISEDFLEFRFRTQNLRRFPGFAVVVVTIFRCKLTIFIFFFGMCVFLHKEQQSILECQRFSDEKNWTNILQTKINEKKWLRIVSPTIIVIFR